MVLAFGAVMVLAFGAPARMVLAFGAPARMVLAFGAPARMVLAFGAPAPNAGVLALVVGIVGRWRLSAAARSMVLAFWHWWWASLGAGACRLLRARWCWRLGAG